MSRISRRLLMRGGAVAGLLVATGAHAGQRQVKGHLRIALPELEAERGLGALLLGTGTTRDCLTEISAGGELRGELADRWDSEGARVWDVQLRPGITDHEGMAFTAGEAARALRTLAPGTPLLADLEEVSAPAPDHLRLVLSAPDPDLPLRLADSALTLFGPGGAGTGLYRLEEFLPGEMARLSRQARHYKDGTAGWFSEVTLIAAGDSGAEMVRRGLADIAALPSGQAVARRGLRHVEDGLGAVLHGADVVRPDRLGPLDTLDHGRLIERWWFA